MISPPDADEIEVTLFGPGYGESVLVHLGEGRWLVVDSCLGAWAPNVPAPLWYFDQLGLDPASAVGLVLVSHWHDDHVAGISRVIQACSLARVALSSAFPKKEFLELVTTYSKLAVEEPGVSELSRTLRLLAKSTRMAFANQDRQLLVHQTEAGARKVFALSPSDLALERALVAFGKLLPEPGQRPRRIGAPSSNESSVALWIEAPPTNILLGADLEEFQTSGRGWTAVLESSTGADGKASYFKIPHHGSETAYCPGVWAEKLVEVPVACVSPFKGGSVELPRPEDVARIQGHTSLAYATGRPRSKKAARDLPKAVQKTLKEQGKTLYYEPLADGYVTARWKVGHDSGWRVKTYGEAGELSTLYPETA